MKASIVSRLLILFSATPVLISAPISLLPPPSYHSLSRCSDIELTIAAIQFSDRMVGRIPGLLSVSRMRELYGQELLDPESPRRVILNNFITYIIDLYHHLDVPSDAEHGEFLRYLDFNIELERRPKPR